jgi:serine/threonine protein kinase
MSEPLRFRRASTGDVVETEAEAEDTQFRAGEYLMGRMVKLDDGTVLRQHRVPAGEARDKGKGYSRLDREVYAGRMLHEVAGWLDYPAEVACLYGDEATSADPYTLFEPYLGEPLREAVIYLDGDDQDAFQASLAAGLCWLAAAGIAHRALSPETVLWDSRRRRVQITDFSRSAVFGADRAPVTGPAEWIAPESRAGRLYGTVGPRDDIWAAGRLIFFARNQGADLRNRAQLANSGLEALLGPPEGRPLAGQLLESWGERDPAGGSGHGRAWLSEGRTRFLAMRAGKHPGAQVPPDFNADISWEGGVGGASPPGPPPAPAAPPAGSPPSAAPPSAAPSSGAPPWAASPGGPGPADPDRRARRRSWGRGSA